MPAISYTRPKVTGYQKEILDCPERFTVTEASTKSGKTASHIIWLLEAALGVKANQSVWWVAPVFAQAKIAFNRMRNQITDRDFFKVNQTDLTLTLPTGAIIAFKSAEKPDNLYGDDVYAAVFDEFTRAREESWFALRSTLTATKGKCKFIGNVKGKKNWGYRLAQNAKSGTKNYAYFKITAYDAVEAGILDADEIEDAKRTLPERVFNELYLADASDDGSNPFGIPSIKQCTFELSKEPAVCYGIDLAKSYDYAVIIGLDRFQNVCHFERWQSDWGATKRKIMDLPKLPMAIDSTGVGDPIVEEIQKTHPVEAFQFTSRSKQQIMEGLAVQIQQRKLTFPEGHIVDELETFEYIYTRNGVKYSAPEGMHDDCVCALALAVHKYSTSNVVNYGQYNFG
jgi:phage FluMu gp28-like protein